MLISYKIKKNSFCRLGHQQPRIASHMAKIRALVSNFACKKIHLHDGFFYFSYKEIFSFQILYTKIIIILHLAFLSSYIEQ